MRAIRFYNDTTPIIDFKKYILQFFLSVIFKASFTVFNVLKFMKNTLEVRFANKVKRVKN